MIRYECAKCGEKYYQEEHPHKCHKCDSEDFYWDDKQSGTHRCQDCCDCDDCQDKDKPCHGDCPDKDDECYGCYLAGEELKDLQYEFDRSQGRY